MVHLVTPDSWPFFSKIINFSGPNGIPYKNATEADILNASLFRKLDCCKDSECKLANVECLRSKTVNEIQLAAWSDGSALPQVKISKIKTVGFM